MSMYNMCIAYFRCRNGGRLLVGISLVMSVYLIIHWTYLLKNRIPMVPPKESLETMTFEELSDIYHSFMNTVQFKCNKIVRAGAAGDGGWNICVDPEFLPKSPCLVYSFGIGDDASFDMAMRKQFNCEVFSFDPTLRPDQIKTMSPLLNFYPIGLCDQDITANNRSYKTLYSIRKMFNHLQLQLPILKMDIEMWEWRSIAHALVNHQLDDVKQLLVEFHLFTLNQDWRWNLYYSSLTILRDLELLGFRTFSVQRNEFCQFLSEHRVNRTACHNIHFVRVS